MDEAGEPAFLEGTLEDITERKRAQEEMQKLATVVTHSSELVNLATLEGQMTFINETGSKMLGIDPEEVEQYAIPHVIPEDLLPKVQNEVLPAIMEEGGWEGELQYRNVKTGELTDVHASTFIVTDPNTGAPLYLANVSRDITARKQAQEALLRLEMAVEQSIDGIAIPHLDGNIQFVNRAWAQMHGYSVDELQGKHLSIFHTEEQLQKDVIPFNEKVMETGANQGEVGHVRKDGTTFPTWMSTTVLKDKEGKPVGLVGTARDISEQKLVEMERQRFTTQLSTAADIARQVSTILDPDELLNAVILQLKERFNLYYAHFYRLDEATDELVLSAGYGEPGRVMLKEGHSIPLDREVSLVAQAARSKEAVVVHDVSQDPGFLPNPLLPHTKSEVAVPVISGEQVLGVFDVQHDEVNYFTQGDLDVFATLAGQIASALVNARLFEEQQQSEQRFRENQERLELALEAANAGVWEFWPQDDKAFFNERWFTMLGYEPDELEHSYATWRGLLHPDDLERTEGVVMPAVQAGEDFAVEFRMKTKDDGWRWIHDIGKTVEWTEDGAAKRMIGTHTDITQQKQMEQVLEESAG
jgi:PAS domain S-box-containing protein